MTYELAKQLKDAGFVASQEKCFKDHEHGSGRSYKCGYLPNPTLSELIEACGAEIYSITQILQVSRWEAQACWPKYQDEEKGAFVVYGSTPEEAVAKLRLALNQHKS